MTTLEEATERVLAQVQFLKTKIKTNKGKFAAVLKEEIEDKITCIKKIKEYRDKLVKTLEEKN